MASVPEIPSDFRDHIVKKCHFFCFVFFGQAKKMKERRPVNFMALETLLEVDHLFFTLVLMPLPRWIHSRTFNPKKKP